MVASVNRVACMAMREVLSFVFISYRLVRSDNCHGMDLPSNWRYSFILQKQTSHECYNDPVC